MNARLTDDPPARIDFFVPGEPQGKGRARIGKVGGFARMFTPEKTVAYEGLIALAARQVLGAARPHSGSVNLFLAVRCGVPPSWSKRKREAALAGAIPCVRKPDLDNVAKAVADAGNGVLWDDDRQIVCLHVDRYWSDRPGLLIVVERRS